MTLICWRNDKAVTLTAARWATVRLEVMSACRGGLGSLLEAISLFSEQWEAPVKV